MRPRLFPETKADPVVHQRRGIDVARLEDRLLFSTAPVPVDVLYEPDVANLAAAPAWNPGDSFESTSHDNSPIIANGDDVRAFESDSSRQLALIDARIDGVAQLVTDLQRDNLDGRLDIVVYQGGQDALRQLTGIITDYHDLEAIHWITHGSSGSLDLGSSFLTASNIYRYADLFTSWRNALTDDADLLVYGCNAAASEDGTALMTALASYTGADVAASDDRTGNLSRGGDWYFECTTGTIETVVPFSITLQAQWRGLLETMANVAVTELQAPPQPVHESRSNDLSSLLEFEEGHDRADESALGHDSREVLTGELLQFSSQGHVLGFGQSSIIVASTSHMLQIELVGVNLVDPEPADADTSSAEAIQTFTSVTYAGLWDGVTAVYDPEDGAILKSTYYVDAGVAGNPVDQIRLHYNRDVSLDEQGNLVIAYDNGTMTDSVPVAWQDIDGQRIFVDVQYVLLGDNQVGFTVGDYDHSQQLVIDPALTWTTFSGAGGLGVPNDYGQSIAVDASGNVYVAGMSNATWGSPVRAISSGSAYDAFLAKLDSSGNLTWNTFLGGTGGDDYAYGVAVDSSGNAYVTGMSIATWGSPVRAFGGGSTDAFVAKVNSSGTLTWNTFLGGAGSDYGNSIAVDASGNVYVAGTDYGGNTWGSPVRASSGGDEAFAAKLNSSGALTWNTFLGSSGNDYGQGVAVDSSGNVYLAGYSSATWGAPVRAYSSGNDSFAVKLSSSGAMTWNTFLGGSAWDQANSVAVDGSGNVYVGGYSSGTWGTPVTAFSGAVANASVGKLNSSGNLTWNTFYKGAGSTVANGIAVDGSGNVDIAGNDGNDAFAAQFNSNGNPSWNQTLGGGGTDQGLSVAVDGSGNVYVSGSSSATWGSPVRPYGASVDAYVAKLSVNVAPVIGLPGGAVNYTENAPATVIDATATAGDSDSANFDTGTLTIDYSANGTSNDRLAIRNEGTGSGQIGISGANVTYNFGAGAVTIGTWTGGTGVTPLVITFNASSTPAAVQALIRNITYANVSDDPSTAARTVRFVLTDGDGGTSTRRRKTINVTAVVDHLIAVDTTSDTSDGDTPASTRCWPTRVPMALSRCAKRSRRQTIRPTARRRRDSVCDSRG